MKELSLNILDIAENSVRALADLIEITIIEDDETLKVSFKDNGCGMTEEMVKNVIDPFCTTRTTRKVGLGIPLLKLQAEQTGGHIEIRSKHKDRFPDSHGTDTCALFFKGHIDMTPLGDIVATVVTLIQCNEKLDFLFIHKMPDKTVSLDTRELREVLEGVPLNTTEVIMWIKENLIEQYASNS